MTNNVSVAGFVVRRQAPRLRAGVDAPLFGSVGVPLSYWVSATTGSNRGASFVRLCAPPTERLRQARATGTFLYRGARCRDYRHVARNRTVGFTVTVVPAGSGRLPATAVASARNVASPARASARIQVGGLACAALAQRLRC